MIGFVIGLIVGTYLGALLMALCQMSRACDAIRPNDVQGG